MNFLAGAAAGAEIGTSIGNLVLSGLQFANQQKVQQQQLALYTKQLDLAQQQLNLNKLTQDPMSVYQRAVSTGFDPVSARQLSGSHEVRTLGNVSLPALDFHTINQLTHSSARLANLTISKSYSTQLPKPGAEPVLTGYRPLRSPSVSSASSAASTMNYDSLPWHNRPRLPSTISSSSSVASTMNYDSFPWRNRPQL